MPEWTQATDQHGFLRSLLAGAEPTVAMIVDLLCRRVEEDLHLDYKAAEIINADPGAPKVGSPKDFKGKVRKHVAGFANGDGGVLVLGVAEYQRVLDTPQSGREVSDRSQPRLIQPLQWSPDEALRRTRDALSQLRLSLHPSPRLHAVAVGDAGCVLVIAVPRAEGTVFCLENEQRVYYVRLHDSTAFAPAYLLDDMILGRRRRPLFTVDFVRAEVRVDSSVHSVDLLPKILNTGLVWMDRPRIGMIGFTDVGNPQSPVSEALTPYLDIRTHGGGGPRVVAFEPGPPARAETVAPFHDVFGAPPGNPFLIRDLAGGQMCWAAAMFVVCHNQPPAWYQILVLYADSKTRAWALPLGDRRAVVALHRWNPIERWSPKIDWFDTVSDDGNVRVELRQPVGFGDNE